MPPVAFSSFLPSRFEGYRFASIWCRCVRNTIKMETIISLSLHNIINIILLSEKNLIELTERTSDTTKRIELKINADQMEYIIVQRWEISNHIHTNTRSRLYRAQEFKYLGSFLTQNNDEFTEIEAKLLSKC